MAKTITITYEEQKFTLEYTRKTIATMERRGFNINKVSEAPMSMLPALFEGAFLAHHSRLNKDYIEKIFNSVPKKEELIGVLADMYSDPLVAMFDEPEDAEGNASWEVNG